MRRLLLLAFLTAIAVVPASASAAGAGSTVLVSRPDGLGPVPPALDGFSSPAAVSDDGRYALFSTSADGFAEGGDSKVNGLLLRDTQTGTTTLVSRSDGKDGVAANADARRASIAVNPAGHVLVAFDSEATNLSDHVSGPIQPAHFRDDIVWLRDVTAGTTTLISRATGAAGAPANNGAFGPSLVLTAGGPVVAFTSAATNLGGGGFASFLRTVDAGTTQVLTCRNRDCSGAPQSAAAGVGDLRLVPSAPGTLCAPPAHPSPCVLAAFQDQSGLLGDRFNNQVGAAVATAPAAPGQGTGPFDNFRAVSVKSDGTLGNKGSFAPSISADGRAIAFLSVATNITGDAVPGNIAEAFVHRLNTGGNELLSRNGGNPANQTIETLDLGGDVDHLRAVFETLATNLGSAGTQRHDFLRDVAAGTTSLVNPAGDTAGGAPSISADGSAALFAGLSPTLDDKPGDLFTRVHLRRLNAPGQPVELVSRPNGTDPLPAASLDAFLGGLSSVSADGRYVTFTSITRLTEDSGGKRIEKAYVRDLSTGRTILVSRAGGADGVSADADAFPGGISADGRKVVFSTAASNIDPDAPPGVFETYVRDLDANTTTLVSRGEGADGKPGKGNSFGGAISGNGRAVIVNTSAPFDPAADDGQSHVYVRDLQTGTMTLADRDSGPTGTVPTTSSSGATIDFDGTRVAWASAGAIAGAPADGKVRVFLRDLPSKATSIVSRVSGPDGAIADGRSFFPSIDAAGDTVAFVSDSPNLGVAPNQRQAFVREVGPGTTTRVSEVPDGRPSEAANQPSIDAAGDRVAFSTGVVSGPTLIYVRDLPSATTQIASRVDGPDGAPVETDLRAGASLSANGDCVVFDGRYDDLGDGWKGRDFESVHMRVLRGECPGAQPVTGEGPPPENDDDGTATPPRPVLSSLAVVPSRFWTGGRRSGTTIRFKLSHAARVTLRFDRLSTGHRRGRRCVSGSKARGKRCTIVKRAGSLTVNGNAGSNRQRFSGKLKGKRLALGRYRITATVAGGSGKAPAARAVVVRTPKAKVRRR
jgi:Tol biopolymer transport system component